jgi:uncharacterized membrane protein YqjE
MEQSSAESATHTGSVSVVDLIRLLRSGSGALFVQAALHGQLVQVEWAQEKHRFMQLMLITLAGFACLLCLLLAIGALLLALGWDTSFRWLIALALVILYGLGFWLAWRRFLALVAAGERAFIGSQEELAADLNLLRSRL